MHKSTWITAGVLLAAIVAIGYFAASRKNAPLKPMAAILAPQGMQAAPETAAALAAPMVGAVDRVTKKPFGLYITPKDSPVSPERFIGFHTGVDFETASGEQKIDVPIYAICSGKLLIKEWASGYGGVINMSCTVNGQAVTVTYGHLRLASVGAKIGETIARGEKLGVLGAGYSAETDGERKHLHLGIHKGGAAKLNGYVATKAELASWINALDYIK